MGKILDRYPSTMSISPSNVKSETESVGSCAGSDADADAAAGGGGAAPRPAKKVSTNAANREKWLKEGNTIPKCINVGCGKEIAIRHWSAQGDPSAKTECSRCSGARIKGKTVPGVTFHKKAYCENRDGSLGFVCPMDPARYSEFPSDIYHMDHLDGNHYNNVPENLKTFCSICHTRKGRESGDFNGFKESSRIHKA